MLTGMRTSPNEDFRFMRIPVDEDGRIETFFALHRTLTDPKLRPTLAGRVAQASLPEKGLDDSTLQRLTETTERSLRLFGEKGFQSIGQFIEQNVPATEREKAADVFIKILQGAAWEAWLITRQQQGLSPLALTPERAQYARDALWASSDVFHYGAPVYLQLNGFDEVRASVFQVTRSPGQIWVFLGSLFLVAGVGCMLFIRERRAFVLIKDSGQILFALSANRKTLDFEDAYIRSRDSLHDLTTKTS
jgi:cytochrome c biogenesis protein